MEHTAARSQKQEAQTCSSNSCLKPLQPARGEASSGIPLLSQASQG